MRVGIEKQRGDVEIELRIDAEDGTDQSGNGGNGSNAGSGSLLIAGGGTVVLSPYAGGAATSNTYVGGTTVSGAGTTLTIAANSDLGSVSGGLTLDAGTTLDLTASTTLARTITVAGDPNFDVAPGDTVSVTSAIESATRWPRRSLKN